jgi:cytochrome oxidase Cu insertion factor (SCO1/SenC/PrrC family)
MKKRPLITLILILLVIIGPIILAWFMVKYAQHYEFKKNNNGVLISVPSPNVQTVSFYDFKRRDTLSGESLIGKWWIVYVSPEKCFQECQENLYNLRQIQVALGKNSTRVGRIFVAPPHCSTAFCEGYLPEHYPEMQRITFESADFNKLFLKSSISVASETLGQTYIIDPLGNVMMYYDPDTEPKSILNDLKRLLKVSKVG